MSVQITYFVHGTSLDNEHEISSGWSDSPLSQLGERQAELLKEQNATQKFDAVFCSDLQRAHRTAILAFEGSATPIKTDQRLRECNYGKFNGQPSHTVEPMQENMITEKFPEGESYEDVKNRLADFIEMLKRDYDGKHVAIVAHKAPQLALDVLLKGKSWEEAFAQDWRKTKAWQPGWPYIAG